MKPKDLLHAMNDIDPQLVEQSIRGEQNDSIAMTAQETPPAEQNHPIARIVGTVASIAACAVVVTGGVLWLRHANAQRPQVAANSLSETERAADSGTTESGAQASGTDTGTTVTAQSRETETGTGPTAIEPYETQATVSSKSDHALDTTTATTAEIVDGTGTVIPETTVTVRKTDVPPESTDTTQSTKTTTSLPDMTDPPQSSTEAPAAVGFPCEVTPKIWKTSWYDERVWHAGQPSLDGMLIQSTQEMFERNAVDDCTYVYENCGFANDAFFKDFDLIVCAVQSGTGSIEVGVKALTYVTARDPFGKNKSWVTLDLAEYFPEVQTCDMCTVCIAIPVPKGLLPAEHLPVYTFVDVYETQWDDNGVPIRDPDPYELFLDACPSNSREDKPETLCIDHAEALID